MHNNIIFMDGEFAQLKSDGIDLLSIALIKPTGEELYLELKYKGKTSPFVKKHVIPNLTGKKVSKKEAIKRIKQFVGSNKPNLVAYINQFDWMGICGLFEGNSSEEIFEKVPFHWVPIDLASILFMKNIEPGLSLFAIAEKNGINTKGVIKHNALDDARILKKVYEKIIQSK